MELVAPVRVGVKRRGDIGDLILQLLGRVVAIHSRERRIGNEVAPLASGAEESLDRAIHECVVAVFIQQLQLQRLYLPLGARRADCGRGHDQERTAHRSSSDILILGSG